MAFEALASARAAATAMNDTAPARFPKTARVRSRAQYSKVFEAARRHHHAAFTLHRAAPTADVAHARLGQAVSRKVDARAVGRNRIKRVLRETFRQYQHRLLPGDLVIVAKPAAAKLDNSVLAEAFIQLLHKSGALPRTDPAVTMPGVSPLSTDCRAAPRARPDVSMSE